MRVLPEGLMTALYGSIPDGRMEFTCWYDGVPVAENLPINSWGQRFSGGQQVSGSTSVTVIDESGDLAPWGVDEPLDVGGSILQSRLILDNTSVPMGWQRITASTPNEVWRRSGRTWISSGSKIDVTASDLTVMVAGDKFITPESPMVGNTCQQEIRRLLSGIMSVTFEDGTEDMNVPASLTYRDGRLDAVEDLISALGCGYRVTATGLMSVYKPNRTSVWTVTGDQITGNMISVGRSQSIDGLKNLIVARNTLQGGEELQAVSEEQSGPLRVGGPHGRWPEMIQDDFSETIWDIQRAADAGRDSFLRSRVIQIPLQTIFHPGLEVGDWITVMCPMNTGEEMPLEGRVTSIDYRGTRLPVSMSLNMEADLYDVQAVSEALRARRWARG